MRGMSMLQMVGGVAAAGVVAAGTTAFTANAGITQTAATQYVGGAISQTVTGAGNIDSIGYTWSDGAKTLLTQAVVTFGAALPASLNVAVTPGGGGYTAPADSMTCSTSDRIAWTCITQTGSTGSQVASYHNLGTFLVTVS